MASFVSDASVCLAWCFEDEATPWTDGLLGRLKNGEEALVAAHWPMEIANALLMAARRGRLTEDKADRFLENLRSLPIRIDPESTSHTFSRTMALARLHKLTAAIIYLTDHAVDAMIHAWPTPALFNKRFCSSRTTTIATRP